MSSIAFIDTEIDFNTKRILDIGCIKDNEDSYHSASVDGFAKFIHDTQFLCGHNIVKHDLTTTSN